MKQVKLYQAIASTLQALRNCIDSNNAEWISKHGNNLDRLFKFLPSGSGFNTGCHAELLPDMNSIMIVAPYQCMDEHGYIGWVEYHITVKPSLAHDFVLSTEVESEVGVSAYLDEYDDPYYHDIDYIEDVIGTALEQMVDKFGSK